LKWLQSSAYWLRPLGAAFLTYRRRYDPVSVSGRLFWGAAASGPQTEGISNKPHRSIWDSWFAEQPERFYQQIGPQTVCDTYHQYPRTWR
jgi:hypothetical protein